MRLIVEAPATYEPERRYVLGVVLTDWLGLAWELRRDGRSDVRIRSESMDGPALIVPDVLFSTPPQHWLSPASLPAVPLAWRPVGELGSPGTEASSRLPVLYGPVDPAPTLLATESSDVRLGVDVFGAAFFMLTRYEELIVADRDSLGRFPASASLADREGFLHLPIVDAYVELLWRALRHLWPRIERKPRRYRVALTHDVDRPLAVLARPFPRLGRQLAADVILRRDGRVAVQRVRSWAAAGRGDYRLDPYNTFDFLLSVSEAHGSSSAVNFMAATTAGPRTGFYTLDVPWVRSLIVEVHQRGHEVGFHAGLDTYLDAELTRAEFARLRAAADELGVVQESWGGRQHYLQWSNPQTWSNWERAGLAYDSTLGFADKLGFRAGTCHDYPVFHAHERRTLRLRERPLHVMEGTLVKYMGLSPVQGSDVVLEIARQCRRYDGTLTLLWHNSSLVTARERDWYKSMVAAVVAPTGPPSRVLS
jgi:hypothetical protein